MYNMEARLERHRNMLPLQEYQELKERIHSRYNMKDSSHEDKNAGFFYLHRKWSDEEAVDLFLR